MAKTLLDRYTAVGIGGRRESKYNRATAPALSSNTITSPGTRDIRYGLRPDLDGIPKPEITTVDDTDVMNRPWDQPSEIQRVSKIVKVDMTWPRLTLLEAAIMISMAMSNSNRATQNSPALTKIMCLPKNEADDLELYSACLTVNSKKSAGVDMAAGTNRHKATHPDATKSANFNPGIIRAYDGFFVNSFELSMARGGDRMYTLTIDGYASGSFTDAYTFVHTSKYYQNNYAGAAWQTISAATDLRYKALRSYVDSRRIQPKSTPYLRGTDAKFWLAFTNEENSGIGSYVGGNARRITGMAFGDRSEELAMENLLPTGSNTKTGPALLDLNNIAHNITISYNNNVDLEDLMRPGGGDSITAAEKGLSSIEVSMEIELEDYYMFSKLYNQHTVALQMICEPVKGEQAMTFLFPQMRISENALGRKGVKRTQTIMLKPLGRSELYSPMYADFTMKTADLDGGNLLAVDASGIQIADRE